MYNIIAYITYAYTLLLHHSCINIIDKHKYFTLLLYHLLLFISYQHIMITKIIYINMK